MLRWKTRPRKAGELYVVLEGDLTEAESLADLQIDARRVVLNLARVRYINSQGSRRLLHFLEALDGAHITAELCPPSVVDVLNLIPMIAARLEVASVIVPVECPECFAEDDMRVHLDRKEAPQLDTPDCERCGAKMDLAVIESRYFAFLNA